ncbi:hypothetical protein J7K74_02575 [Candidatus Woesearchaeota archaeon]|nr:hypothetical protein [Candidatus Woesearchaeota archaeon]
MRKTQLTLEFLAMTIAILLVLLTISIVASAYYYKELNIKRDEEIRKIGIKIKQEISMASISHEGYVHVFQLPANILGKQYNITSIGEQGVIKILTDKGEYYYKTPIFNGSIIKGENTIRKTEKGVIINE